MIKAYFSVLIGALCIVSLIAVGVHHSGRRFNKYTRVTLEGNGCIVIIIFIVRFSDIHKTDGSTIQDNIKSENIKKYLRIFTAEPHIAGTDANKKVAYAIANAWTEAGLEDVHTLPYEVLLSYPDFENPNSIVIQAPSGKEVFRSKGVSPVIIPDEQSGKCEFYFTQIFYSHKSFTDAGHQWLAYAGNGSVSAEVVYVNRGTENDFKNLKLMGVDVKGKIALMRYGHGFRGDKVYKAQLAGAIGAVLFSDTSDVAQDGVEAG